MTVAARGIALILVIGLLSCGGNSDNPATIAGQAANDVVRFVVIGDHGTGGPFQYQVGTAISDICAARGCDFVVTTGDNIYDDGVASPSDPQFESKFELPHATPEIPWYLSLGNHDINAPVVPPGSVSDSGDHQVAYSYRSDRISDKWRMPARWYSVDLGLVEIFILDSNRVSNDGVTGDNDTDWLTEQRPFLNTALADSTAPWRFAFAHHPYRSNGGHQNPPAQYQARIRDLLCGRVDGFVAGHDHVLSWLEQAPECVGMELLVSGAGGQTPDLTASPTTNPQHFHAINTYGFLYVEVFYDRWSGTFYNQDQTVLFQRTVTKTR